MTEQEALQAQIEQEISKSQARLQKDRKDSYWSHVWAAEEEELCSLCQRLKEGESREEMLAWLRQRLPQTEQWMRDELDHPTFDWYDEHYHYKRLEGRRNAYKIMENLLAAPASQE